MPTQSFPKHMKGVAARPATDEATTVVELNWSKAAENTAEALGINPADLKDLEGSGKDGLITVADVKNWGGEPEAE